MADILRCLIVENEEHWQVVLKQALTTLGGDVEIHIAPHRDSALEQISERSYDLATVDLSLLGEPPSQQADEAGLGIVEEFFKEEKHLDTALLVVTGHATNQNTIRLLEDREVRVFKVLEKNTFQQPEFLAAARAALLDARYRRADKRVDEQYRLRVMFGPDRWIGSELEGPDRGGSNMIASPVPLSLGDLSRRGDLLNVLRRANDEGLWREEAHSLGRTMYEALQQDRGIANHLAEALGLSSRQNPLMLQFCGPSAGLGLPFELMQDGDEYSCFRHVIVRELFQQGASTRRRTQPFRRFLKDLKKSGRKLRVLVVGANSDGNIPKVEEEAHELSELFKTEGTRLGLQPQVTTLTGAGAEYSKVIHALEEGEFHLFHYAGHGRFEDTLPEVSGLVFSHEGSFKTLTAASLHTIVEHTPLQLVFLSACVGARTAQQAGRGDFQGVLESLARADVPTVVGYRWSVGDDGALELAKAFYSSLWKTLSPSRSLLDARRSIGIDFGRDDDTWASPIILCQAD